MPKSAKRRRIDDEPVGACHLPVEVNLRIDALHLRGLLRGASADPGIDRFQSGFSVRSFHILVRDQFPHGTDIEGCVKNFHAVLEPVAQALEGGDIVGRLEVGASSAEQLAVRVGADDCDFLHLPALHWEQGALVLQEHDALAGDLERKAAVRVEIDGRFVPRGAAGKVAAEIRGAQEAPDFVIDRLLLHGTAFYHFEQCLLTKRAGGLGRHGKIAASVRGFQCVFCARPVGDDEAFEAQILFQHMVEKVVVLAAAFPAKPVRACAHRRLEPGNVNFP